MKPAKVREEAKPKKGGMAERAEEGWVGAGERGEERGGERGRRKRGREREVS